MLYFDIQVVHDVLPILIVFLCEKISIHEKKFYSDRLRAGHVCGKSMSKEINQCNFKKM